MNVIGCVLLAGVSLAMVAAGDGPAGKVKVTLVVILASEEGDRIDKRLIAIADEVRAKNPKLKSFQLKSMECRSIGKDEKADFQTVDGKKAVFVLKHCADKSGKICLAVTAPNQGEIVYESACGKFLPIITRYETQNKERLILAIRVQPCKPE